MKLHSGLRGALLISITFTLISWWPSAVAAPSPSPSSPTNQNKTIQELTKKELTDLYVAIQNHKMQIRLINDNFKFAIDEAFFDAKFTMKSSSTPEQKNIAISSRRLAITAAITARESAIELLGPAPAGFKEFMGFKEFKEFMGFAKDEKLKSKQARNSKRS